MDCNTINIKQQQLAKGFFQVGTGDEKILILGSCRVAPYVDYFNQYNELTGNRFTIFSIDPFNWSWDANDNRIDREAKITAMESDPFLLNMLSSVDYFIHEYYSNFGMFNCSKESEKNIYQFGMNPKIDVTLPNFNDFFILFGDIVQFDTAIRKMAVQDYNVIGKLSVETIDAVLKVRDASLQKFYDVCRKSSIPELEQYFKENDAYKLIRFFWNFNHVTKEFTCYLFKMMNDKFFGFDISNEFYEHIYQHDMFANNYTYLTEYDTANGFQWPEEVKQLREKL